VAVKSVEKNRRKKVLNEVRIFHNLKNRHILRFFNWYETRNHLWIIFEYCAGGDLFQLIEQDKQLPEDSIKKFGRDLAQGLYYLHANSIVYCDLKPSNVLLNEYSTLKLCDFGLSRKLVDLDSAAPKVDDEGEEPKAKSGTPYYMAPNYSQMREFTRSSPIFGPWVAFYTKWPPENRHFQPLHSKTSFKRSKNSRTHQLPLFQ